MNPYLDTALVFLNYFLHALVTLFRWILYPLKPVYYLFYLFALPFIYLGHFFSAVITYPARRFPGSTAETLYIYLSTAAIFGVIFGLALYTTSAILKSLLQLDPSNDPTPIPEPKPARRSISQYRASRRAKQESLKHIPLADLDTAAASILSPRSLSQTPVLSPTMTHSPTRTDGKGMGRWSRKGLLSPQTIMEEGDSDEYF